MQVESLNNLYVVAELAVYAALVLLLVQAALAVHAWADLKKAEAAAIDWETEYRWAEWRERLNQQDATSGVDLAGRTAVSFELEDHA